MFDYLIKNGQLIDGTGSPARRADVGITDGKIAAIGDLSAAQAGTVIDAAGKTVTPGFIDIHRHADAALFRPHFGELELKQGLTTIVNGNCGLSITSCSGPYRGEIEAYLTPVTGELPADADCSSMPQPREPVVSGSLARMARPMFVVFDGLGVTLAP